ncbi:MAG: DNA starvation/stationary phase protection protein Dps [Cyanobacteria bacterium P01_D01_bin.123]
MTITAERTKLYATTVDISTDQRAELVNLLNQPLASVLDLKTQVKQAHWNVKGMQFIALHEMFDTFATTLEGYVDMLAERATALGGVARGTVRIVARESSLPEYDLEAVSGRQHVVALAERYGRYANQVRAAISQAEALDDADTADLFTEISRQIDKDLWFLEAHLQGE